MKSIVPLAVALAACASFLLRVVNAYAGDAAALSPLGFSRDGRYFAFEQYGTESVSGIDYSETIVVDLALGRAVQGAPLLVDATAIEELRKRSPDRDPLALVRQDAKEKAAPLLKGLGVDRRGGRIGFAAAGHSRDTSLELSSHSGGQPSAAVTALRKATLASMPLDPSLFDEKASLELSEFAVTAPVASCADNGYAGKGFVLTLRRDGKAPLKLGASAASDNGEACPLGFGLVEAHALRLADGSLALAALLQRFDYVMEGPDRRFLAVGARVR